MLKSVYLSLRKVKAHRVTVIQFEMYNRSGDGVGCLVMVNSIKSSRQVKKTGT